MIKLEKGTTIWIVFKKNVDVIAGKRGIKGTIIHISATSILIEPEKWLVVEYVKDSTMYGDTVGINVSWDEIRVIHEWFVQG